MCGGGASDWLPVLSGRIGLYRAAEIGIFEIDQETVRIRKGTPIAKSAESRLHGKQLYDLSHAADRFDFVPEFNQHHLFRGTSIKVWENKMSKVIKEPNAYASAARERYA